MTKQRLFIITGISGAGKSQALKCFEDFGFFCVDNLPIALIDKFSDLLLKSRRLKDVALGIDIREGEFLKSLPNSIAKLRAKGLGCRIIFLDASDAVVIQRFSETRHRHPLGKKITLSIREERRLLTEIKGMADKVIDTSDLTLGELKEKLSSALEMKRIQEMNLSIVSFGFKHGLPLDADLVMDVRFLPNPNYQPSLKGKTGLMKPVQSYVLRQPATKEFLKRFTELIESLLPHYIKEGKSYLTLAVGCTGGHHRSVFIAHHVAQALQRSGYRAVEYHRDIQR
jgi:RNase adapter protein RapZ